MNNQSKLTPEQLEHIRNAAAQHLGLDPDGITMMISTPDPEQALAEVIADLKELQALKAAHDSAPMEGHDLD